VIELAQPGLPITGRVNAFAKSSNILEPLRLSLGDGTGEGTILGLGSWRTRAAFSAWFGFPFCFLSWCFDAPQRIRKRQLLKLLHLRFLNLFKMSSRFFIALRALAGVVFLM